jgi:hypothetical protein
MEWLSALFEVLWEQALFVILIPIVLVIGILFYGPFEWISEKMMTISDNHNNKVVKFIFGTLGLVLIVTPVILVFLYEIYFE